MSAGAPQTFEGKVALVTGAGRGIGRAIALGLATGGARVALLARSKDELDEVARAVHDLGGVALVTRADVGDPDDVALAVRATIDELGAVDILINNAAVVWPLAPSVTVDAAEWGRAIRINVIGLVTLTLAVLPTMLERGWGRIVNVSSGASARPAGMIGGNAYVTSKAAVEAHTLNLAAEPSGTGVTVNAYRPGAVDTAMQGWIRSQPPEKVGTALHDRFVNSFEQGTLISPEQSARALLTRLPSDATGEIRSARDV